MEQIHIATASDDRYAQHAGVMMASLLENAASPQAIRFHIVDAGIEEVNRGRLKRLAERYGAGCRFIPYQFRDVEIFVSRHINAVSYIRLHLSELLDESIDKVLYLDCDIVVNKDISKLWEYELGDFFLAAVDNTDLGRNLSIGIPVDAKYFNAGVLLIDLRKWRNASVTSLFNAVLIELKDQLKYHDQDVLNKVLHDKWLTLKPTWNVRKGFYSMHEKNSVYSRHELDEAIRDPAVIHYTEASKPWHYLNHHPRKADYYRYLHLTEWKDFVPPEKGKIDDLLKTRKIVLFGIGHVGKQLLDRLMQLKAKVSYIVDNDPGKWNTFYLDIPIYVPDRLRDEDKQSVFVFIASMYYEEIGKQLEQMGFVQNLHFCAYGFEHRLD